jgi:hypothetical protein
MPCQPGVAKQSEYEYFTEILSKPDMLKCAGPLTPIGFVDPALSQLHEVLIKLELGVEFLDNFQTVLLESNIFVVNMCAKHWFKHSQAIATAADSFQRPEWIELATLIFKMTCVANNWDYKEIYNYTITSIRSRQEE